MGEQGGRVHIRRGSVLGYSGSLYVSSTSAKGERKMKQGNEDKEKAASSSNLRDLMGNVPWPLPFIWMKLQDSSVSF